MKDRSILEFLSKNLNSYQSTRWLKSENEKLNGASPAELIMENKAEKVMEILPEEIRRIKGVKSKPKP